jgi:5-methylcytosine-specific restriction endonuclease McrA
MKRKLFQRKTSPAERIRARVMRRRRAADANAKRRARLYTEQIEDVSIDEVRRRDVQTCHLCGRWVSVHEQSLDHVTPLSKGGAHTYDNIKLAHAACNSRKRDRLMDEINLLEF